MEEVRKIQSSLISGEREKRELMKSLAQVKDDLTRLQLRQESPDTSSFNLNERISAASQTDLCSENFPLGAREMAKLRLRYDEWRKRVKQIQERLAGLEERIQPGEVESDQERLLLFQEKKQLLLEYRSLTAKSRTKEQMERIQATCKQLESELNNAYEESNQCIATRLKVHEEKQMLLQQLLDALKEVSHLEKQLRSVSQSTLSISSGSSLGSLSTASSKGSLSRLSFTDIYGDVLMTDNAHIEMVDINRRVAALYRPGSELSLSPRSSLSGETPPASPMKPDASTEPMYENTQNLEQLLSSQDFAESLHSQRLAPPLSPIYEKPSILDIPQAVLSRSSSASNTRSVSAAVSDESVAGDSGVFEASRALLQHKDTAQIQIGLKYSKAEGILLVSIERARNLLALFLPTGCQLYIKAALLPGTAAHCCRTQPFSEFVKPLFSNSFAVQVPLESVYAKSLQIKVMSVTGTCEEWVGNAQISLAEFNPDDASNFSKWYNIISMINAADFGTAFKEESSDESTIISSQASTLTRNQNPQPDDIQEALALGQIFSDDEDEEEDALPENEENDSDDEHDGELIALKIDGVDNSKTFSVKTEEATDKMLAAYMEDLQNCHNVTVVDKETNTECAFLPQRRKVRPEVQTAEVNSAAANSANANNSQDERIVKRSQTFSPR